MKNISRYTAIGLIAFAFLSCKKESNQTSGDGEGAESATGITAVVPIDIHNDGFDLLEKMQGHWIGKNRVIASDYEWFAFDYRPISSSHLHGIYEGGTIGNLLTSFFVTDFKGKRTIMARNGGLLNGIYRTSYFVLDSIRNDNDGKYFRLVDAVGGAGIMSMELKFNNDSLHFNAYTSRLATSLPPTRHMTFKAKKQNLDLSNTAAAALAFPQNTPAWDFSEGFMEEYLSVNPGQEIPQTATFLSQDESNTSDLLTLALASGDPFTVADHPYLANLDIIAERGSNTEGSKLLLYLSKEALTDSYGYLKWLDPTAFNSILKFPEIAASQHTLHMSYLHPGSYYITVIADINQDGIPSEGDISSISESFSIAPEASKTININDINYQN